VTYTLNEITERAKFITVNALSVFVLVAIAIQALIYKQQREIMEKAADYTKIGERAYIGIRAVSFEGFGGLGKKPRLGIRFLNGGRTPAWNVSVGMKVSIGTTFPTEKPQVVNESNLLPAGVDQEVWPEIPVIVTREILNDIMEEKVKFFVRGEVHFKDAWNNKRTFYFNLVYRPKVNTFGNYKEQNTAPLKAEPSPRTDS
jgi:hypothetical protein